MANQEHLDILKQGVESWNKWRGENLTVAPDLSGADLSGINLSNAYFRRTDFRAANLTHTKLVGANLSRTDFGRANLKNADLVGADLTTARLVETNCEQARLTGCSVYGASVWNVRLEGAEQSNLIITPVGEPIISVDDLEVAQFIYLLLNHQRLRNILNSVTRKGVLILGRFGRGGLEVLQSIAEKLRELKYLPIIFDFDRPADRNYTETVKTLVGLSRFVIVDLSGPSVPQELYATVPHFKIPFIPIIETGIRAYSMFLDILEYPWVLKPPIEFSSKEELIEIISSKIVAPAENMHRERQELLDTLFNSE